jgi:spermidine/putrescine transport system permease protein
VRSAVLRIGRPTGWSLALPAALFLLVFLVVPAALLGLTSFWRTSYYETTVQWNLRQYQQILAQEGLMRTLLRSVLTGLVVAVITAIIALPVAYYLRFRAGRWRLVVLGVIVTALFSSYLVRIYAWRTLLGRTGAINWALETLHLTDQPVLLFFYNRFAVVLTLIHILLPFAILLLFASLEGLDADLLEASRVLGASGRQMVAWVVLPIASRGLAFAFAFTFILAAGDYVTPQLVGGTSGSMIGTFVMVQFLQNGDYSHGAALSLLFLAALLAVTGAVMLAIRLALGARR